MSNSTMQDTKGRKINRMYQELYGKLLAASNEGKKVSDILSEIEDLCATKRSGNIPYIRGWHNGKERVLAIECKYFRALFPLIGKQAVEFSKKEDTYTGFATLSKPGSKLYNARMNDYKDKLALANEELIGARAVLNNCQKQKEIQDALKAVQVAEQKVASCDDIKKEIRNPDKLWTGFTDLEQCIDYLVQYGADSFKASKSSEIPEHLRHMMKH